MAQPGMDSGGNRGQLRAHFTGSSHAALAYYHVNKEEIDADIEAEERFYEASMQPQLH